MIGLWFPSIVVKNKINNFYRTSSLLFDEDKHQFFDFVSSEYFKYYFFLSKVSIFIPYIRGVRLKYKGKTMRSKRVYRRYISFKVGKSHPAISHVLYSVSFKRTNKQKFTMWSYSNRVLRENIINFRDQKYPNLYHGRGIRPVRMKLFWKEGKVSAYR